MTERAVRVAIVEDDPGVRDAFILLINGTPGFSCTAGYGSAEEALSVRGVPAPDVLLMDINLPGKLGSEAVADYRALYPTVAVLMLTVYDEDDRIFESLCNGACGYMLKNTSPAKLLEAITEAARGGSPMTPSIARRVITRFRELGRPVQAEGELTAQEVRILSLLADGGSYHSVAQALGISINTVRNYVRSIYDKLHVHTKAAAVSKAIKQRLI